MRDFTQMNELTSKFSDSLAVLGFPSNQFGHQTGQKDFELLNSLKYVRPGDGYEPNFEIFSKCECNGDGEEPLFKFLKASLPDVSDDNGGRGADYILSNNFLMIWSPLRRSDIIWNFEKFLINQEGKPVKRYSPKFETIDIAADIETLIKEGPDSLS